METQIITIALAGASTVARISYNHPDEYKDFIIPVLNLFAIPAMAAMFSWDAASTYVGNLLDHSMLSDVGALSTDSRKTLKAVFVLVEKMSNTSQLASGAGCNWSICARTSAV